MLFYFILRVSSVFLKLVVRLIYKQRKCRLFLTFLVLFYCELQWVLATMYCENPRRLWPGFSSRKVTSSELQNILRFLQVTWSKDRFGGKNLKSRSSLQRTSRFSIYPPLPPPRPTTLSIAVLLESKWEEACKMDLLVETEDPTVRDSSQP